MNGVASLAALALAAVLVWAGVAKLLRPNETARDFKQLGLPTPAVLARAVPLIEMAIAVALVVVPGWGGVAAFVLLAAFTTWLYSLIRSGVVVSCGCFGSASTEPVTLVEVARNAGLLVLAATAATITSLAAPDLPAVILFTTASLIGLVLIQLVGLAQVTNGLFRAELAGELTADPATNPTLGGTR